MTRWKIERRSNEGDQPTPSVIERTWCIMPVTMAMGYPAVIAEFPFTAEGRDQAEDLIKVLNAEYVAGMKEAQRAARHALGLLK